MTSSENDGVGERLEGLHMAYGFGQIKAGAKRSRGGENDY